MNKTVYYSLQLNFENSLSIKIFDTNSYKKIKKKVIYTHISFLILTIFCIEK